MAWDEATFEHLLWYVTAESRPRGELETRFGSAFSPVAILESQSVSHRGLEEPAAPGRPKDEAEPAAEPEPPTAELGAMIEWLEEEVAHKALRQRAARVAAADAGVLEEEGLLAGNDLEGQAAVDAYVSELVAALRDFPYNRLQGGQEAGSWVRDEVIAPNFRGRWNFYSNRKCGQGFDLPALDHLLCGENMLLDRLRYARRAVNI
mmetsp:Transcript_55729/g.125677  ORF Transcript_55729/g.125677 Transcript_55729/m.125677 type:complete len:206 (-) Transcript_55729:80-697(-)